MSGKDNPFANVVRSKKEVNAGSPQHVLQRAIKNTPPKFEPPKTAAIYARYSTDGQNERSLERQIEACKAYAKLLGLTIVAIFTDVASGKSLDGRSGMRQAINAANQGEFHFFLVEAMDRVARDQADNLYLYKHFTTRGIEIHECPGGIVHRFHAAIKGFMSEEVRLYLLARCAWGRKQMIESGLTPHKPKFGYTKNTRYPGILIPHQERLSVVAMIFKLFNEGALIADICRALTGVYPSPSDCNKMDAGKPVTGYGPWFHQAVASILESPLYTGLIVDGVTSFNRDPRSPHFGKRELRPLEDWRVGRFECEPVVDEATWESTQKLLRSRVTPGRRVTVASHMLFGRLFCMNCGCELKILKWTKRHRPYVRCPTPICKQAWWGNVVLKDLERIVIDLIQTQLERPELLEEYVAEYMREQKARLLTVQQQRAELLGERQRLQKALERSFDEACLVGAPKQYVQTKRVEWSDSLAAIELRLTALGKPEIEIDPTRIPTLAAAVGHLKEALPLSRHDPAVAECLRAVRAIVVKVLVKPPPPEGLTEVLIQIDRGAAVSGRSADTSGISICEVSAVLRARPLGRGRHVWDVEHAAQQRVPLSPDAWSKIETEIDCAPVSLDGLGWSSRALIEVARGWIYMGDVAARAELIKAHGPSATFGIAARVFIQSGVFTVVCDRLSQTADRIVDPDGFMPSVVRPTASELKARKSLYQIAGPRSLVRRCGIVAAALDGMPEDKLHASYSTNAYAAQDMVFAFKRGGIEALQRFDRCSENALLPSAVELERIADEALSPLHETRLRGVALRLEGKTLKDVGRVFGVEAKAVKLWMAAYKSGNLDALRDTCWVLRYKPYRPPPASLARAASVRSLLADCPDIWCRPIESLARYLEGGSRESVLDLLDGSSSAFQKILEIYRAGGIEAVEQAVCHRDSDEQISGNVLASSLHSEDVAQTETAFIAASKAPPQERDSRRCDPTSRGRPKKLSSDQLDQVVTFVKQGQATDGTGYLLTLSKVCKFCNSEFGVQISVQTMRNLLRSRGMSTKLGRPRSKFTDEWKASITQHIRGFRDAA